MIPRGCPIESYRTLQALTESCRSLWSLVDRLPVETVGLVAAGLVVFRNGCLWDRLSVAGLVACGSVDCRQVACRSSIV